MPYKLKRSGKGWKVGKKGSSKTYSKKPMSRSKALKQMRAIQMNSHKR